MFMKGSTQSANANVSWRDFERLKLHTSKRAKDMRKCGLSPEMRNVTNKVKFGVVRNCSGVATSAALKLQARNGFAPDPILRK
jgi:hypothetical protein